MAKMHNIEVTILFASAQLTSVKCTCTTTHLQNALLLAELKLCPHQIASLHSPTPSPWLPPSYLVSIYLTNPGTSHHWNHTVFVIL